MLASDFDAMQAELQALQNKSAEVRHAEPELAPPVSAEIRSTHEAVANLDFGVEHQLETSQSLPPENFAENPLIVDQQAATHQSALGAIR